MSAVSIRDVSLNYRTKIQRIDIFERLNLEIEKGAFVVIHGPSGHGKTSLLNLISGCLRPNKGGIYIEDKDITQLNDVELCEFRNKTIGYLFQTFNLISSFNVEENIMLPSVIGGISKKDALSNAKLLMKELNIENRAFEYPDTLSGGEQQRVAFARAVINKPEIILADEPTANLDKKNSLDILNFLIEMNKKGTTIFCVTHDEQILASSNYKIDIEKICS